MFGAYDWGWMPSALWILLSVGAMLILKGVYDEKLVEASKKTRTVYRFLPRPDIVQPSELDLFAPVDARTAGRPDDAYRGVVRGGDRRNRE